MGPLKCLASSHVDTFVTSFSLETMPSLALHVSQSKPYDSDVPITSSSDRMHVCRRVSSGGVSGTLFWTVPCSVLGLPSPVLSFSLSSYAIPRVSRPHLANAESAGGFLLALACGHIRCSRPSRTFKCSYVSHRVATRQWPMTCILECITT